MATAHGDDRSSVPNPYSPPIDDAKMPGLLRLTALAIVGGVLAGIVGGLFRLVLLHAGEWWAAMLEWTRDAPQLRWLVPVALAALSAALARLTVRWAPQASGSGVQRVEATMRGELGTAPLRILPAKFIGGVLAIGSGLALGREGPTVQMGATIGSQVARLGRLSGHDQRTLTASLAGAGLGVAFNAPVGGAVFVFEELARAVRTRLAVATFAGTAAAIAASRLIVGGEPIFTVPDVEPGPMALLIGYALLGIGLGVLGVYYDRLVIAMLDLSDRMASVPPEAKAAAIGAIVGLLGVVAPALIGGGEPLNETVLVGSVSLGSLAVIIVVRSLVGPFSYAAGTPGGLFAPLLVVGAAAGALLAGAGTALVPDLGLSPLAFAIVGMSAFFAAVVRAPLTGVVLIAEMTATTSLLLPMLTAAAAAVITSTLMKGPPIYDTLRERMGQAA